MAQEPLTIENLFSQASGCRRCPLGETRQCLVFGEGSQWSGLMMVGEAPGEKEDETGKPFIGRAGKVLDSLLAETGFQREDIFITSVVKCRPPKNRFPKKEEVTACLPILQRQIELIKPRIIVCLGNLATRSLLDERAKITEVRGKWFNKGGIKIMPTFHPAAVFHDRKKLEAINEDFHQVKEVWENIKRELPILKPQ